MKHFIITLVILLIMVACGIVAGRNELRRLEGATETATQQLTETVLTTAKQTTSTATETVTEASTAQSETITETQAESTTTEPTASEQTKTKLSFAFSEKLHDTTRHREYLGRFYITGYTEEEGFPEGSATASGVGVRPGICALNNAQRKELGIEYGETIYIDGLGEFTVADCGCAYGVVDVWCYTNAEAYSMTGYYEVYR